MSRLIRLENAVNTLFEKLGEKLDDQGRTDSTQPSRSETQNPFTSVEHPCEETSAPVFAIRDLATEVTSKPAHERISHGYEEHAGDVKVFPEDLLSEQECEGLISIFRQHYGRWLRWEEQGSQSAESDIMKSPLLLCACYLIAVRHTTEEAANRIAPKLFECAKEYLATAVLNAPQPIEFFQASLILSMWSTTVGGKPYSIDSWLLTGFALQHTQSCNLFNHILNRNTFTTYSRSDLDLWCIWNHLCLVHLHYCVGTRRKAMLGSHEIRRCKDVLKFDDASNFETRMTAEIELYWTIYENCLGSIVDLPKAQAALHAWKREWDYVLKQPRSQFLEMGFHFAQLLAYERSLKSRSARVREALLSEMVRLCAKIMQVAMDTADERTRHLSDHIYHMITFAAVTLSRLLSLYEGQLKGSHNVDELDSLIWKLAQWLDSIGLPCHAAHTLGDIVSGVQSKLRPHTVAQPEVLTDFSDWPNEDFSTLPDLLDAQISPGGHWNFLPDWEPFYQGPLT